MCMFSALVSMGPGVGDREMVRRLRGMQASDSRDVLCQFFHIVSVSAGVIAVIDQAASQSIRIASDARADASCGTPSSSHSSPSNPCLDMPHAGICLHRRSNADHSPVAASVLQDAVEKGHAPGSGCCRRPYDRGCLGWRRATPLRLRRGPHRPAPSLTNRQNPRPPLGLPRVLRRVQRLETAEMAGTGFEPATSRL